MATIKTLLGNVKGKDGGGYEEVVLYDGNCSACINWNIISADSPMMELSDSIENYKSIKIEFTSYNGIGTGGEEEGIVTTSTTYSVNYIKTTYRYSGLECFTGSGNSYYSRQAFGFYDATHLTLTWEDYAGWEHNMSHITVTGIRDRVSDAEKNFNKYSTTEEVVGTWCDKKPIYRKTIQLSSFKNGTVFLTNVDTLINVFGMCKFDQTRCRFPINNQDIFAEVLFEGNNLISNSNNDGYFKDLNATFEYTKTTS